MHRRIVSIDRRVDYMAQYTFLLQHNPRPVDHLPFCQPGFFFNELQHLQQQSDGEFYLLSALNLKTRQVHARCAFFVCRQQAISPGAAPFGSIECTEALPDAVLDKFLLSLTEAARHAGASSLRLIHYPCCYAPQQTERLMAMFSTHNFRLIENNATFFLPVTQTKSFDNTIIPAERRRLRKCQGAGFQFTHRQRPNATEVVDFIQETYKQQGYRRTIQPDRLISLLQEFPDHFSVFAVSDGVQLAALTITVRVRHDILYNFLPASNPAYHTFSPMVMLIDGLYSFCQQQDINLLDLGVSLDASRQPKPGLIRFKRNLGAQESPKFTVEKTL